MKLFPEIEFPLHADGAGKFILDAEDNVILQADHKHLTVAFNLSRAMAIHQKLQNYAIASMNNMEDLVLAADQLINFAMEVQQAFKDIGVDPPTAPMSDALLSIARYHDQLVHGEKK